MTLQQVPKQVELFVRKNAPSILTGLGVSGVIGTGYLAYSAGYQAGTNYDYGGDWKEKLRRNWRGLVPPALAGAVTIGCIVGANRIGNHRAAALAAAYSLSERAFQEYKEKAVEKLGERKEQSIRDEVAQDRIAANPLGREVMLVGGGTVLCHELHTGRYFLGDMDTLKRSMNEINDRVNRHEYASLQEFYTLIGLAPTESSGDFGWLQERGLLSLEITTALVDETRPCLAFGYNYLAAL